ncbi:Ricin-type beta-trefoil [Rhizoctonia solani]|uniref:Ricin-type beta-trefoil n=1 Tax=Rhizoctonia solani TaxID=456999 RepID=A0A8H7I8L4_9AGAM|nr:Ricin-type beta-trefoil [Rhizoctonia solani]
MSFGPGTYYLVNVKTARHEDLNSLSQESPVAALDLSGGSWAILDLGHAYIHTYMIMDIQWKFIDAGNGLYHIRNVGYGKFITFPDDANDGKQVIATDGPREWEVRVGHEGVNQKDERESIRIFHPGTDKNIDLKDHGDTTAGNIIQLWSQTPGQGQAWYAIPA